MNKKILYTALLIIGLIVAYFVIFGLDVFQTKPSGYMIPADMLSVIRERRRWSGQPKKQSEWDNIAGVMSNRVRLYQTGKAGPSLDKKDYSGEAKPIEAHAAAVEDNQAYYDQYIGQVLGWLKGANLEATGGNVWLFAEEIARYLESNSARNFETITKGQYLPEPIVPPQS